MVECFMYINNFDSRDIRQNPLLDKLKEKKQFCWHQFMLLLTALHICVVSKKGGKNPKLVPSWLIWLPNSWWHNVKQWTHCESSSMTTNYSLHPKRWKNGVLKHSYYNFQPTVLSFSTFITAKLPHGEDKMCKICHVPPDGQYRTQQ